MAEEGAEQEELAGAARACGPPDPAGVPVRWLDEGQQRAWQSLMVMQARLSAALAAELALDSDLSLADYVVLVDLTDRPDAAARVHDLARRLGWERSRVSHHIARMAGRGLVRKERCAVDRRGSFIVVTDEGRGAIEAAAPGHVAAVRKYVVDVLTDEQLDAVGDAAGRVVEAIDLAEQSLRGAEA